MSLALVGCVEDFPPASSIERTRVIGAMVSVDTEDTFCMDATFPSTTASPRSNEHVTVTFVIAQPGDSPVPVGWGFVGCPSLDISSGLGACAGPLFGPPMVAAPTTDPPTFEFDVPGDSALAGINELLVFGAVCDRETPTLDLDEAEVRCPSGGDKTELTFRIPVTRTESPNCNPPSDALDVVLVTDDGSDVEWEPLAEGQYTADCASLPRVPRDSTQARIAMVIPPEARERYLAEPPDEGTATREEFQVSHFTDAGELDRQFTIFEDEKTTDRVDWELPPAELVPTTGLVVHFWFVVRDDRDGMTWSKRALCVR